MPKSEGSVTIDAPMEEIFDAVADQEKAAQYHASGVLTAVNGKPDEVGSSADFDYRVVVGMTVHAKLTVLEVDKPRRLVLEMSGTMPGRWTWNLEQEGQAVKVNFSIDYSVPGGIVGRIANQLFLGRINQRNLETTLRGLKVYCET